MKKVAIIIRNMILSIFGLAIMGSAIKLETIAAKIIDNIIIYLDTEIYAKAIGALLMFIILSIIILGIFVIGLIIFLENFSIKDDSTMEDDEEE